MLTRKQRGKILIRSLKLLHPHCLKRKNLFSDKDVDDLLEELGVHIWIALIRYRKRTYDEAERIAFTVGKNRLTSIVRSKLTVYKKGAKFNQIEGSPDDIYWMSSGSMHSNGVQIIDTLETIASIAIMKVGLRRADSLMRALLYDWRSRKPVREQKIIMQVLGKDRIEIRKLVRRFIFEIRRELPGSQYSQHDNMLEKVDGTYRATGRAV